MPADFLALFRDNIEEFKSGSGDENVQDRRKKAEKVAANERFLNKELKYDEEFDKNFVEEYNEKSDDGSDE